MRVSVIVPVTRADDAERALESIRGQQTTHEVELLTVGSDHGAEVVVEDLNPAVRRNRAAARATGEVLAFIDDDAFAAPEWIETAAEYLRANPEVVAVGGPDPAPADSKAPELLSDTLLSTRWLGSGVWAHENRSGVRRVTRPMDVALVNLFVRKAAFDQCGGFDENIGYIGEDTALVAKLMEIGKVVYHSRVVVNHRRRPFPFHYLGQRWRYRFKTGRLLRSGAYRADARIWLFLAVPFLLAALLVALPAAAVLLVVLYIALCLAAGVRSTRLPVLWWPVIPIAFLLHHAVYFVATLAGLAAGAFAPKKWRPAGGG